MLLTRLSLRSRIYLILLLLLLSASIGAGGVLWLLRGADRALNSAWDVGWEALKTIQAFETSLAMENAHLALYGKDGNTHWRKEMERRRDESDEFLRRTREILVSGKPREFLNTLESKYIRYAASRELLLNSAQRQETNAELKAERERESLFSELIEICKQGKKGLEGEILGARHDLRSRGKGVYGVVLTTIPVSFLLAGVLVFILINRILEPIRKLAVGGSPEKRNVHCHDEVIALQGRIQGLMEDVDLTQSQLQQSREHLLQSEKLAMVGKLAAGVAHSVRNPLTSVKMRLFSLERSLKLAVPQKEDFDVISDEIRHIDAILQNFLEFSRPPKLKIQRVSPSDVVDMSIQLLRHRIESYGAEVELYRQQRLPEIEGDPEQLKEVLVNLIINACEAMGEGGKIEIQELEGFSDPMGRVAVIQVSDSGPGIPETIRDKVFQPFFSTKEEGTGLGLSIAQRIIDDHNGCLNLRAKKGKGAMFIITLPSKEATSWIRS